MFSKLRPCKRCGEDFVAHGGKGRLCPDCIDELGLHGRIKDDVVIQMRNARIKDGFYDEED